MQDSSAEAAKPLKRLTKLIREIRDLKIEDLRIPGNIAYYLKIDSKLPCVCSIIETFSIRFFMGNRKPQFAVTRLQFHVAEISNFSKAFSSVQFIFI